MHIVTVTERRNIILEKLNANGRVNVNELSAEFGVSSVVIRTDLSELESKGLLTRVHGGAITNYKSYYDMSFMQRMNTNSEQKTAIAKVLAQHINDHDTIMMNAGSTMLYVLKEIADKRVTIVTNSIALALEATKNQNFKVLLLGGDVDQNYQFTYGTPVINTLNDYEADLFIMSVDGVNFETGISTYYYHEVDISKSMMKHSAKTYVLADHSKIGRTAFAKIDDLSHIDAIFTDNHPENSAFNKKLKTKGVNVILG